LICGLFKKTIWEDDVLGVYRGIFGLVLKNWANLSYVGRGERDNTKEKSMQRKQQKF
jgi:hypothetical protein